MALIIGGGITIGSSVSVTVEKASLTPAFSYNAGNSMCYSGSGADFNNFTNYIGSGYSVNNIFDLSSDIANATIGNYGFFNGTNSADMQWVNQGNSSYFNFDPVHNTNIASDGLNGYNIPENSSFTYFAVIQVNDFGNSSTSTGGIVGGDSSSFGFLSAEVSSTPYPILIASAAGGPGPEFYVVDATTEFQPGVWYAVATTYDTVAQTMKIYVNGTLTATQTGLSPLPADEPLYWGTWEGINWLNGKMSVMSAWSRALSGAEIVTYTNSVAGPYLDLPIASSSAVYTVPSPPEGYTFTVPEGVTSVSVLTVGAGGGGTADAYSPPGGSSVVVDNNTNILVPTTFTGTGNQVFVDGIANPQVLDLTTEYVVFNPAITSNALPTTFGTITNINSTDINNVTITINQTFTSTSGDMYSFYIALAAAEGGYEIDNYFYNSGNVNPEGDATPGPGYRAKPLIGDGGGYGGVVDYLSYDPIGGGGAGGYGTNDPIVAFNPNQTYLYNGNGNTGTGVPETVAVLSNNNLTVAATANNTLQGIATGTYSFSDSKVMFSLTVDANTPFIGLVIGFGNYNANIAGPLGSDINSGGFKSDGLFYSNGYGYAGYPTYVVGDVVDIAIDDTNYTTWIRVNGSDWNSNPSADPVTNTGGQSYSIPGQINVVGPLYLMTTQGDSTHICQWSINTSNTYPIPSGFTFIAGNANAGSTGGDGSLYKLPTMKAGQGGSGAGGGGRYQDTGAGGGGVGIYGIGRSGPTDGWINEGRIQANSTIAIAGGGRGGSSVGYTGTQGGQATAWNGGYGGFPGGGGGCAIDYYVGGNGGALAYKNNYTVVPGQDLSIIVGAGGIGQNVGGTGGSGAVRIIWPGDTRQFPNTNCGIDEVTVPTLDITAHNTPSGNPSGSVTWNIIGNGDATVLESGIIWGLPGNDNYLNSVDICDGSSTTAQRSAIRVGGTCSGGFVTGLTGSQTLSFNSYLFDNETINIRAYARNEAGVAYSPTTLTWTPSICLAEGTLITLADGSTKTIENIEMSDSLRVWDFDKGVFTASNPLWIKVEETTSQYNLLSFSDGSTLKTINQHRIFNKEKGMFTHPMTDDTPIGTTTINSFGEEVTLVAKEVVQDEVNYYNVVTNYHMNLYANGILTSLRFNNVYPITNMKFVKDDRVLRSLSEFGDIDSRWVTGLRLQEQTYAVEFIQKYIARLEQTEQETCYA